MKRLGGLEAIGQNGLRVVVLGVRRAGGTHVDDLVEHHLLDHVPHGVHRLGHDLHLGRHRHARRADQLIHVV